MNDLHNQITSVIFEWLKTFGYFIAIFTFDYLAIPQDQLSILGMLIVIDTWSGIAKQYRINPSGITSHLLSLGVIKKIGVITLIYTVALIGKWVRVPPEHVLEWGLSILIMAEGYSIIQNIYAFRTGKILPEYDVISTLLKKLGDFIILKINELTTPQWKKQ